MVLISNGSTLTKLVSAWCERGGASLLGTMGERVGSKLPPYRRYDSADICRECSGAGRGDLYLRSERGGDAKAAK